MNINYFIELLCLLMNINELFTKLYIFLIKIKNELEFVEFLLKFNVLYADRVPYIRKFDIDDLFELTGNKFTEVSFSIFYELKPDILILFGLLCFQVVQLCMLNISHSVNRGLHLTQERLKILFTQQWFRILFQKQYHLYDFHSFLRIVLL